jgi:hypothetical protein
MFLISENDLSIYLNPWERPAVEKPKTRSREQRGFLGYYPTLGDSSFMCDI